MRISTRQIHDQGVDALLRQQMQLARTQMQIASGRRILSPGDDPAGTGRALAARGNVARLEQYQRNAGQAESRLQFEETALQEITDVLQRARELAVQGMNDGLSAGDRSAIADEVSGLLDSLLSLANTQDGSGDYLFAGSLATSPPFVDLGSGQYAYQGDQGQRLLQIGPTRQVATGDPGDELFLGLGEAGEDMFAILYGLAADLRADSPDDASIRNIDRAMDSVLATQAKVGARLNAIASQTAVNEDLLLQAEDMRSAAEDVDLAEASARLNLELVQLQASQQSFVQIQNLSLFRLL